MTNPAGDGVDKDWGDRAETALAAILNGFANGTFRSGSNTAITIDPAVEAINERLSGKEFKGTIDTRHPF